MGACNGPTPDAVHLGNNVYLVDVDGNGEINTLSNKEKDEKAGQDVLYKRVGNDWIGMHTNLMADDLEAAQLLNLPFATSGYHHGGKDIHHSVNGFKIALLAEYNEKIGEIKAATAQARTNGGLYEDSTRQDLHAKVRDVMDIAERNEIPDHIARNALVQALFGIELGDNSSQEDLTETCLLYTSDAADES